MDYRSGSDSVSCLRFFFYVDSFCPPFSHKHYTPCLSDQSAMNTPWNRTPPSSPPPLGGAPGVLPQHTGTVATSDAKSRVPFSPCPVLFSLAQEGKVFGLGGQCTYRRPCAFSPGAHYEAPRCSLFGFPPGRVSQLTRSCFFDSSNNRRSRRLSTRAM